MMKNLPGNRETKLSFGIVCLKVSKYNQLLFGFLVYNCFKAIIDVCSSLLECDSRC